MEPTTKKPKQNTTHYSTPEASQRAGLCTAKVPTRRQAGRGADRGRVENTVDWFTVVPLICKCPTWPYNVHCAPSPLFPPSRLSFIQCFGKIVYNVVGKEVSETGKALGLGQKSGGGRRLLGQNSSTSAAPPSAPQGFSPIPAEEDFHTVSDKIVKVVDKWTVKRCMGESLHRKSIMKKGLCFLSTVVMKLIKFVFVTLATTIKHDCSASIGLGASLFPTPFTGFGIEFNTISCGLSALEKIGSTFISLIQLVFKSKEGAEQDAEQTSGALKKEHMSPKYHESAADIEKRRAEVYGGDKGSVMFKLFDGEEGRNQKRSEENRHACRTEQNVHCGCV